MPDASQIRAIALSLTGAVYLTFSTFAALAQTSFSSTDISSAVQRLHDKRPRVRAAAARELGNIGRDVEAFGVVAPLAAALKDPDVDVRKSAAFALGAIGAGEPSPLSSDSLRKQTVVTAVPALVSALQTDTDVDVRKSSATSLGYFGSDAAAALPALIATLDHPDSGLRGEAAHALIKLGQSAAPAVPALVKYLGDKSAQKRWAAARVLGAIGPAAKQAAPSLVRALQDEDIMVRLESAAALGTVQQNQAAAVPILIGLLSDEDYDVRARAAGALGMFGMSAQSALPNLTRALNDENNDVRWIASGAVERIADALRLAHDTTSIESLRAAGKAIETSPTGKVTRHTARVKDDLEFLEIYARRDSRQQAINLLRKHRAITLAISAWLTVACACLLVLWLSPLTLLRLNTALKSVPGIELPAWLGRIKLSPADILLIGLFEYHTRVLNAWVDRKLTVVRQNFERLPTVAQRQIYIETPVTLDGRRIAAFSVSELKPPFAKPRNCILIAGEGGAGKTSLACAIARWAMSDDKGSRFCAYPMLPVLIEEDFVETEPGKDVFIETIRGQLRYLIEEESPPTEELVRQLLKRKRVLVIIDGLSEKAEATRRRIHPENPSFPLNTVVITSRLGEKITGIDVTLIRPMRIQGNRLSSFMDTYLVQLGKRDLFDDIEFFNACSKLSLMVGDRDITVLLARMYAEQMIASKEQGADIAVPANVPELMLEYVNQLNRNIGDGRLDDRIVQRAAISTAWLCLRRTYRPGPAAVDSLTEESVPTADQFKYLEERLRIIQTVGTDRNQIRFSLDPLAEYLAALSVVERNRGETVLWQNFLQGADKTPGAPQSIRGFLLALRDCCLSMTSRYNIPASVEVELATRIGIETAEQSTLQEG